MNLWRLPCFLLKRKGTYVYLYLWLIHVDVWQKPTQYSKPIILQLKINKTKVGYQIPHVAEKLRLWVKLLGLCATTTEAHTIWSPCDTAAEPACHSQTLQVQKQMIPAWHNEDCTCCNQDLKQLNNEFLKRHKERYYIMTKDQYKRRILHLSTYMQLI